MDGEQALKQHSKTLDVGTVLFREGDVTDKIWVINEGCIQLSKCVANMDVVIEELGPGDFCGELSLLTAAPQTVSAVVASTARLLIVESRQFERFLRVNDELAMRMLKKMAGRLNEARFSIAALQLRNNMGRVMLHIRREFQNNADKPFKLPGDMSLFLGIDSLELDTILDKLVAKNLIAINDDCVEISNYPEFNRYLTYLELRDRYAYFEEI